MGVWSPAPGATAFDDTFTGDATNETADGLGGKDTMNGGGGDDSLSGGDDNDQIFGDQGDDTIDGGRGDDLLRGNAGSDTVRGGEGNDNLAGYITTNDVGFGVFDSLFGEEGNDTLQGGLQDLYDGGEGVDSAFIRGRGPYDAPENLTLDLTVRDAGGDLFLPGGGVVLSNVENLNFFFSAFTFDQFGLQTNEDVLTVIGSSGRDSVTTSGGADLLHGAGGDDYLNGHLGDDEIHGGDGDDRLEGALGSDTLFGGAGNDWLNEFDGPNPLAPVDVWTNILDGGDGDDLIHAGIGDVISGGAGADTLVFFIGAGRYSLDLRDLTFSDGVFSGTFSGERELGSGVVLTGSISGIEVIHLDISGADRIEFQGTEVADRVSGGNGGDMLSGNAGADHLTGMGGADFLDGGDGDDRLIGAEGDDAIAAGPGADVISGDGGRDRVAYDASPEGVSIDLGGGLSASGGYAEGDLVLSVEDLSGSAFDDILVGSAGDNALRGGAGADILAGGAGVDTVDYAGSDAAVSVDLAAQTASGGHASGDVLSGFESATGSSFGDALTGDAGDNVLRGAGGDDTLDGGLGSDTASYADGAGVTVSLLLAGAQNTGGQGFDTLVSIENLIGSSFDDVLTGDSLANILVGRGGDDWFVERTDTALDRLSGDEGFDTIDYSAGAGWVIVQLSGYALSSGGTVALFSGIEAAVGSAFDDALIGTTADNRFAGGAGADWIVGAGGDDWFVQGLEGGVDRLFGGTDAADAGFDTIDYGAATAGVVVQLSGWSTSNDGASTLLATFSGVESVIGSGFDDALIGTAADDRIDGGHGSDWLVGQGGDDWFAQALESGVDRLFGDAGIDTIDYSGASAGVVVQLSGYATTNGAGPTTTLATFSGIENAMGTAFDDAIIGDATGNVIVGGAGSDWLVGGGGSDTFVYRSIADGADSIGDFSRTENDRIDISAIDANPVTVFEEAFAFSTVRNAGVVGEAVITNFGAASLVSLYVDADGIADMNLIVVHGQGVVLNSGDFVW